MKITNLIHPPAHTILPSKIVLLLLSIRIKQPSPDMTPHNITRIKGCMTLSNRCASAARRMSSRSVSNVAHHHHQPIQKTQPSTIIDSQYSFVHPSYRSLIGTQQSYLNNSIKQHALLNNYGIKRQMSSEITRGTDLLADSLAHGPRRKIVLESYAPSGVDVKGFIQVGEQPDDDDNAPGEDKVVHMNGSIVAFPDACFLMNIHSPEEVTLECLSVVKLYQPTVEYLFIGCEHPVPPSEMNKIKAEFRKKDVVVEQMDIMNCVGTFNILNGEDRRVACVLVVDETEE
mmetsp:Transcript_12573/g.18960  ORF Transcript_12573/g.18960 Transcript_12573/m.18960 type:complete len:287 (+) Transcript_12573:950-1810(+)